MLKVKLICCLSHVVDRVTICHANSQSGFPALCPTHLPRLNLPATATSAGSARVNIMPPHPSLSDSFTIPGSFQICRKHCTMAQTSWKHFFKSFLQVGIFHTVLIFFHCCTEIQRQKYTTDHTPCREVKFAFLYRNNQINKVSREAVTAVYVSCTLAYL